MCVRKGFTNVRAMCVRAAILAVRRAIALLHVLGLKNVQFWTVLGLFLDPFTINVRVRVRNEFWQIAHVRATCVRPRLKCANVRACDPKIRRNSHSEKTPRFLGKIR